MRTSSARRRLKRHLRCLIESIASSRPVSADPSPDRERMAFRMVAYVSVVSLGRRAYAQVIRSLMTSAYLVNLHPEAAGGFKCAVGAPDVRGL